MKLFHKALAGLLTAVAISAAVALSACSGTTSTATVSSDLQLLANALAAEQAYIPASDAALVKQVQTALATVQAAVNANPNISTIQGIATVVEDVAPAIVGLFPGGGTAVTIVDAAVALLPELESLLGVPSASVASARVGVPAAYVMTPEMARAVLATLPKA